MTAAAAKPRVRVKAGSRPMPDAAGAKPDPSRPKKARKAKAKPPLPPMPLDTETIRRARKAHWLYVHGGTEGECEAAKARLEELAARCAMGFGAFLAACDLEATEPAEA